MLKSVTSHYSYNSQSNTSDIFRKMFPDSRIAQNFKLGESKSRYVTVYGLGDYFSRMIKERATTGSRQFVLLFDESLSRVLQKKQLDIHLRFYNGSEVETRYYTSYFLGKFYAVYYNQHPENIIHHFLFYCFLIWMFFFRTCYSRHPS